MSSLDIEALLAPLSDESPCGDDLSYDPAYMELERSIQGTGEQQVGESVIEAIEPNWNEIQAQSLELLGRTRDLRVVVYLTLATMKKAGLPGLRDGLSLLARSLNQYWDQVYPQLDPDDDNDPMERMNIVASLAARDTYQDPVSFLKRLREIPVVQAPALGSFSLHDHLVATGRMPAAEGESAPQASHIAGAFQASDPEAVAANGQAINEAVDTLRAINDDLYDKVGPSQAPDMSALEEALQQIQTLFAENAPDAGPAAVPEAAVAVGAAPAAAAPPPAPPGEVNTRADVLDALDKICKYYAKHEPSSPLPMLLKRARKLAEMDFVDIIKDMVPDSMPQIQIIGGLAEEGSEGYEESYE